MAFFHSVVFIVVHKSLCNTDRNVLYTIVLGLLGLYNFKLFLLLKKVICTILSDLGKILA
jgi:hypothetical protein